MCRVRRVHTESVLKEKMVRCVKVNLTSCVCFEVCKVLLGVYFCVDCYPEIPARICKSYFELVERIISIMRDVITTFQNRLLWLNSLLDSTAGNIRTEYINIFSVNCI